MNISTYKNHMISLLNDARQERELISNDSCDDIYKRERRDRIKVMKLEGSLSQTITLRLSKRGFRWLESTDVPDEGHFQT